MTLLNTKNPDIAHAVVRVVNALFELPLERDTVFAVEADQRYLAAMVREQHVKAAARSLNRGDFAPDSLVEMCTYCQGTGWIVETVSVPFDGGYLPDYIDVRCNCNPEPTDADLPDWQDVPELYNQRYPGIDYDAA
jgi:hypothetical protein